MHGNSQPGDPAPGEGGTSLRQLLLLSDPADGAQHPLSAVPDGVATALAAATGATVAVLPPTDAPSSARLLHDATGRAADVVELARGHDVVHALDVPAAAAALAARRLGGPPVLARVALAGVRLDADDRARVAAVARSADALLAPSSAHAVVLRPWGGPAPVEALLEALGAHELAAADGGAHPLDPEGPPRLLVLGGAPWSRTVLGGLLRSVVEDRDLQVSIAGAEDDAPARALRAGAERFGVAGRIAWPGDVAGGALRDQLDAATLVLDPGNGSDAARVPLAAMARGRAVVAPTRPAAADVLVAGVTGAFFHGGDERSVARTTLATARDGFRCSAYGVAGADRLRSRFAAERVLDAVQERCAALAVRFDSRSA